MVIQTQNAVPYCPIRATIRPAVLFCFHKIVFVYVVMHHGGIYQQFVRLNIRFGQPFIYFDIGHLEKIFAVAPIPSTTDLPILAA